MEIHAFRLTPGQDLKKSLLSYAKGAKLEAACVVTCVGSLSKVSLRLANADGGKRGSNETVSLEERFEIVSLAGTVSRHGCHLHMSLSDYQGNVVGGHVLDGCVVFTTAEMVLGECVGHVFTRERDDETGFDELVVTTKLAVAPPPRRRNGSGGSEVSVASAKTSTRSSGDAASGSAERRSDRDAPSTGETGEDARSDEARGDAKQKKRGFFGWLGSVVAPDPPANYATDIG
jgi:predicted DNA-binding protein with PD1-like motif